MRRFMALAVAIVLTGAALQAPARADGLILPLQQPVWLCNPDLPTDACGQNTAGPLVGHYPDGTPTGLDATVVKADGTTSVEPINGNPNAKVDCFYAYPTVNVLANPSVEVGSNPPVPRDPETAVTLDQVARLAPHCRLFVPLYRQATILAYLLTIIGVIPDFKTGYGDLKQAFDQYWNTDNIDQATGKRRGIVILGHSQGSGAMLKLLQDEFDGNAEKTRQLVGAYVIGGDVLVPTGGTEGGGNDPGASFQHLPACARASAAEPIPVGCVVAYNSSDVAAGEVDKGGTAPDASHHILCVNPAALLAGDDPGATTAIRPYLPTEQLLKGNPALPKGALTLLLGSYEPPVYPTGFAAYPGLGTGQCSNGTTNGVRHDWLQISGMESLIHNGALGLHVYDYNVEAGDIAALIQAQADAWQPS